MDSANKLFLDPTRNDQFSKLRGFDLQDLIIQIENFYLTYRDKLGVPENVTFGLEIEYENLERAKVHEYIRPNFPDWISKTDETVPTGGEIASPILHDDERSWQDLKTICEFLRREKAEALETTAAQVHVGAHILGEDINIWRQYLKTYEAYESVLFRFFCGDKVNKRANINFGRPISNVLHEINWSKIKSFNELKYNLPLSWSQAINFTGLHSVYVKRIGRNEFCERNTLEYRSPNGTNEEVIWQNNVNAIIKLMLAPVRGLIDEDFVEYKRNHEFLDIRKDFYMYQEVCLKNALEFVDLVFENNLDKVYFLRQYLKGFEEAFRLKGTTKAKRFIR